MNNKGEYYQVGGNLGLNDPSYIERQADKDLYEELKAGNFCYVFDARQTGKSSLLIRVKQKLENEGYKCASISLDSFGTKEVTRDKWYYTFIKKLSEPFNFSRKQLSTFWQDTDKLTPLIRLDIFFSQILLTEISEEIIIFIDEIDAILGLDFAADDFFTFIRYCYNQRAINPEYNRITFVLLGVSTPSQLIKKNQTTPFNIGVNIQLMGFSFNEARSLAKGLEDKVSNTTISQKIVQEILYWTGGQPFLTQKICKMISQNEKEIPFDEKQINSWVAIFIKFNIINDWESQDNPQHLRTIRHRIINSPEPTSNLLKLYLKIFQKQKIEVDNSLAQSELKLSGLIVEDNEKLKIYNRIYENIFDEKWVEDMLNEKRPYQEELLAWKANKNKSWLLRGKKLRKSILWTVDKNLTIEDYQFLNASQELELKNHQFKKNVSYTMNVMLIILSAIFSIPFIIKIPSIFIPYISEPSLFSQGDKSFFNDDSRDITNSYKSQGIQAFNTQDYERASDLFKNNNHESPDPEMLIYHNNAKAHQKQKQNSSLKSINIAVAVPVYSNPQISKEILRGVAQAQDEFNQQRRLNQRLLNVVIGNDQDDPNFAQKVAQEFVKDKTLLGVIGHYSSRASQKALPEYENGKLAMISSGSSNNDLSNNSKVFFRTIPPNRQLSKSLAEYASIKRITRVAIYYKAQDPYSDNLEKSFEKDFDKKGITIVRIIDLNNPNLDVGTQLPKIISNDKADAAVFMPSIDLLSTVFEMIKYKPVNSSLLLLGSSPLYHIETLKQSNVEGLVVSVPWFNKLDNNPYLNNFVKKSKDFWKGEISWRTASSYDAAKALIRAISLSEKQNLNPTRETILNNLRSLRLPATETSGEPLKFNNGERENAQYVKILVQPRKKSKNDENNCNCQEKDKLNSDFVRLPD